MKKDMFVIITKENDHGEINAYLVKSNEFPEKKAIKRFLKKHGASVGLSGWVNESVEDTIRISKNEIKKI